MKYFRMLGLRQHSLPIDCLTGLEVLHLLPATVLKCGVFIEKIKTDRDTGLNNALLKGRTKYQTKIIAGNTVCNSNTTKGLLKNDIF